MQNTGTWEDPLQAYALISLFGGFLLLPVLLIKFVITQELFIIRLEGSMISALSHFTYNVASITVLQSVSPLTHAILNLAKRVVVILVNIVYFHTSVSFNMSIGLFVFFIGLFLYYIIVNTQIKKHSVMTLKYIFVSTFTIVSILLANQLSYLSLYKQPHQSHSLSSELKISTSWVYDKPMPRNVIANIEVLTTFYPVHVYCGTSQCAHAISELSNSNITVEYLVVSNIVKDMSLEHWLARHPFNKILAGADFEGHLHEVVRLGILWHYGSIYVDPLVRVSRVFSFPYSPVERDVYN